MHVTYKCTQHLCFIVSIECISCPFFVVITVYIRVVENDIDVANTGILLKFHSNGYGYVR